MDDDREKIRQACHEALKNAPGEPTTLLLGMILMRLDRLETGSFTTEEKPTEPERRASSSRWRNDGVLKALEEGKKEPDGSGSGPGSGSGSGE